MVMEGSFNNCELYKKVDDCFYNCDTENAKEYYKKLDPSSIVTLMFNVVLCPTKDEHSYKRNFDVAKDLCEDYASKYDKCPKDSKYIENLLAHAITCGDHALKLVSEWIYTSNIFTPHSPSIDYNMVWIRTCCEDKKYLEEWHLDAKKCLITILTEEERIFPIYYDTWRYCSENLLKHSPDIIDELNKDEKFRLVCLGLICLKCNKIAKVLTKCTEDYKGPNYYCSDGDTVLEYACDNCSLRWTSQ